MARPMGNALGPERRTMPTPPSPGGVAMATMVSFVVIIDIYYRQHKPAVERQRACACKLSSTVRRARSMS